MNDLVFDQVSFGYQKPIFENLNVTFQAGKRHSLVGPNAVGKSTLIGLATGMHQPRIGRVMLGDSEIRRLSPKGRARRLAVVPQFETNVFQMTVREMVATGRFCWQEGYFAGHPDAEVEHAMARAGAMHLASRSVWDLSGGERQRVLIARALAQKADWMLLDEATTFLDLRAEFELLRLLEELHAEGLSILSVTHDLQAASRADQIALLTPGKIQQGTPDEILTPARLEEAYGIPFFVERRAGLMLIGPAVPPATRK